MKLTGNIFLFILLFFSLAIQPAHLEILAAEGEEYYFEMTGNGLNRRSEQELLNQAIKDYQEQNYEAALDKLVQVLDLNPRNREAIDYIQKIKRETSRIEEVKGKVTNEQELLNQAIKDYQEQNYEVSLDEFVKVLDINAGNREAIDYIQKIKRETSRIEEVKGKVTSEQELLNQAIKDYQEQNYEAALDRFVKVLDINPGNRKAIDYIQRIKEETGLIERVKSKVISDKEKHEAERLISPEMSKIARDIEIIKREVAKRKLEEPKELPAVISKKRTPIMPIQVALFLLFGSMLAGAFFAYRRKVLKRRELSDKNLKLMENLSRTATNVEHKGEILGTILRVFVEAVEAKSGALFTVEDKTGDLVLRVGIELGLEIPRDLKFNKDSSVFAELSKITSPATAAQTLERSIYENLSLFKEKPASPSSFLLVPLVYKNRNAGVVLLNCKKDRENYLRQHRRLIETLAGQAAIIVANIAYDRQVIIDGLTGLYVHWFFYQCLEKEISRAERQDSSLALLMVDLDHFKQFNDTYGHLMGDKALMKVAEILKNDLRDIDTVARYGGEEFAIILPGVDEKLALITAERIRNGLESYRFQVVDGKFRLTLSIGSSIYEKGVTAEEMVEKADKALYWVKQHGRNQVKSWASLANG
jgi:diguanylate cyclase (GGDEF)-like protein